MGISLTGLTPATTYDALIKVGDNGPITSALKVLSDGLGTNLPMEASTTGINFTGTLQQSGVAVPTAGQVAAKQDTLVSGTNIKTINSTSILGSGNIAVVTSPSGVSGAIQFSNGSAFASDSANFFWDDTNNRLGIGTATPTTTLDVQGSGNNFTTFCFNASNLSGQSLFKIRDDGTINAAASSLRVSSFINDNDAVIGSSSFLSARLGIKGSGSTSATTSLLVQNSAGTQMLKLSDDGQLNLRSTMVFDVNTGIFDGSAWYQTVNNSNCTLYGDGGGSSGVRVTGSTYSSGASQVQIKGATSISSGFNQPDASAQLQADSTTKGFLMPRMTTTQINAIASPANGLEVYNTTLNCPCFYDGTSWRQVTNSAM